MSMRSLITLLELFEPPKSINWEIDGGIWASFYQMDGISFELNLEKRYQPPGTWDLSFQAELDRGSEYPRNTFAPTGETGAKSVRVYAWVLAAVRDFIAKEKPEALHFSGSKGDSRAKLYTAMARHLAKDITEAGYEMQKGTSRFDDYFTLLRRAS